MTRAEVVEHAYVEFHAGRITLDELRATLAEFGVKLDPVRIKR